MTCEVKIIEDTVGYGVRLTTYQLRYPRFIHCFDEETEILVKKKNEPPKFMPFAEAVGKDWLVAQVNEQTLQIEFVEPLQWIEREHNEDMVSIDYQRLSMLVTKEHRLLVDSRKGKGTWKRETILAGELLEEHTTKKIHKAGFLTNEARVTIKPEFAKLIAFFISDGHISKQGLKSNFHFRKQRKIDEVKKLLNECDIDFVEKVNDPILNDKTIWFNTQDWMKECYVDGNKVVPKSFWNMDQTAFTAFKQGLLESDGNIKNNEFNSFSAPLIESLCVIFHLNGDSFNIKQYGKLFKVKFQKEKTPVIRRDKSSSAKLVPYSGKVYCVSVPSSFVMVRRKGIVHISGNCELMTHRVFSRNASSSRAIPTAKLLEMVKVDPAMPVYWGKNQSGMQAREEIDDEKRLKAIEVWLETRDLVFEQTKKMVDLGVHKQIANRMLEPWHYIHVVLTATEFDNFFELRCHKDAQPEIRELAEEMRKAYNKMEVTKSCEKGWWHLPYTTPEERETLPLEQLLKISTARCARVSYMNHDGTATDLARDVKLHDMLVVAKPPHMSPAEHQAVFLHSDRFFGNLRSWKQYRKFLEDGLSAEDLAQIKWTWKEKDR